MHSMRFTLSPFFILWSVFITAFAAPEHFDQRGQRFCKNLRQRREWRTLTDAQKSEYIKAVNCLQAHPAQDPVFPESKTRFDEFQGAHIHQAAYVHLVGQFLGWHRHFLQAYENALRNECGYTGYSPYWDWSQDADLTSSIKGSPIFDPITGFGGDGVPGTYVVPPNITADQLIIPAEFQGCVLDGPFANYTLALGPGKMKTSHCLTRGISDAKSVYLTSKSVANLMKQQTFAIFHVELEGQPITPEPKIHDGGHFAVGGEMSNFYSSPGDPIFYLHHANLDRIWWNWQKMLPRRIYEIGGSSTYPPTVNLTLDQPLDIPESLGATIPLWKVMNIHSEYNCYTYV